MDISPYHISGVQEERYNENNNVFLSFSFFFFEENNVFHILIDVYI